MLAVFDGRRTKIAVSGTTQKAEIALPSRV